MPLRLMLSESTTERVVMSENNLTKMSELYAILEKRYWINKRIKPEYLCFQTSYLKVLY
jgi:hypothetical protein